MTFDPNEEALRALISGSIKAMIDQGSEVAKSFVEAVRRSARERRGLKLSRKALQTPSQATAEIVRAVLSEDDNVRALVGRLLADLERSGFTPGSNTNQIRAESVVSTVQARDIDGDISFGAN